MVCSAALRFCCEKKIREYDCPLPQAADKVCAMDPCAVCQTGPLLAPLLAVAIISTVGFSQRERERERGEGVVADRQDSPRCSWYDTHG